MIPAPPEGSKPAMVRVMGPVNFSLPFIRALFGLFQDSQASFEVFEHRTLSAPDNRAAVTAKITCLLLNSTGKLGIETAVILDDPPVGRHMPPTIRAILFGSFRND